MSEKKVLLLVGSAKRPRSTSESLGTYLLERLEQSQACYDMARTLLTLAGVLAQADSTGPEAKAYAERAREIFTDLGAKLDIKAAEALIAEL